MRPWGRPARLCCRLVRQGAKQEVKQGAKQDQRLQGKTCLVTGANTGIGLETVRGLANQGATVIMTSRSREKGEAALAGLRDSTGSDRLELLDLDLASFASIRRAAAEVLERHAELHVLVNNAGLILGDRRTTEEGLEMTLGVNHFGTFLLTQLLRERIEASAPARIVNVSSEAHRGAKSMGFDDLQSERSYSSWDAYGRSKLANILFTAELAEQLEGKGVTANSLHPGVVRSGFARDGDTRGLFSFLVVLGGPLLLSAKRGARTSIYVASSPEVEAMSGLYFKRCKALDPSHAARDGKAQKQLWKVSEELTTQG